MSVIIKIPQLERLERTHAASRDGRFWRRLPERQRYPRQRAAGYVRFMTLL
jgi:hypothetical protein